MYTRDLRETRALRGRWVIRGQLVRGVTPVQRGLRETRESPALLVLLGFLAPWVKREMRVESERLDPRALQDLQD